MSKKKSVLSEHSTLAERMARGSELDNRDTIRSPQMIMRTDGTFIMQVSGRQETIDFDKDYWNKITRK
jgi:hypothetical protein